MSMRTNANALRRAAYVMSIPAFGATLAVVTMLAGCAAPHPRPQLPVAESDQAADDAFQKASNRPPTTRTLYVMAKLYAGQNRDAEAEGVLLQVIRADPKFVPAYCDLAEVQLRQRRVDDAIRTIENGLKNAPRESILTNDLGMCHLLKKDYGRALQAFLGAAALRPDDARYRSNAALALGMLGRYDEALSLYTQVLPQADAHYNLGVICETRRDNNRAASEFRKAIELQDKRTAKADGEVRALGAMADAGAAKAPGARPPASAAAGPQAASEGVARTASDPASLAPAPGASVAAEQDSATESAKNP